MRAEHAIDRDAHALGFALPQGLGGQDVPDLRRANTERQRAERAMRRGVRIPAHQCQARQRDPLFGSHDMHDALAGIVEAHGIEAVPARVGAQPGDQGGTFGIGDRQRPRVGRDVVVRDPERQIGTAQRPAGMVQHVEPMEPAVVHKVTVDPQQIGAIVAGNHDMGVPYFVEQGLGHGRNLPRRSRLGKTAVEYT